MSFFLMHMAERPCLLGALALRKNHKNILSNPVNPV